MSVNRAVLGKGRRHTAEECGQGRHALCLHLRYAPGGGTRRYEPVA